MIDYDAFCRIKQLAEHERLNATQIADTLGLDVRTVAKWLATEQFRPRSASPRQSKLDPYKTRIQRWLEAHPYTATQVFQRLREAGYHGGQSIVRAYVRKVRPPRRPAFLTLTFAPGECAQVDWGSYGTVAVGETRRRLSFFVMVLCHSRMMYLEFTVSQTLEHFLTCHQRAFEFFRGVPQKIMVDNLKSAVLQRPTGQEPVYQPRYLDLSRHYGFTIRPCGVGKGNEKGGVENAVGYVKKNFLNGLDIPDFRMLNTAGRLWLDTIANVRIHGHTRQKPTERFAEERPRLIPLAAVPYDGARVVAVRATNRFRVTFETNRYSVPAEYASASLTLKAWPDHLCVYHRDRLIARHPRSYDRNRDFEDPEHPRALLAQRRNAREQRLLMRFLALSPKAQEFHDQLSVRRPNAREHMRKIVALSEIHDPGDVARALEDAVQLRVFGSDYIANLLEQRARTLPEAGA
ncbi:MAG: IS21 family transposase, partial [Rhodobacteraceae bacterium]|nr:IS21 family transposase [Paracoccaceae bacterium]